MKTSASPVSPSRERTARRRPRWARAIEALLWIAGASALAWVGWGYLDARLYQQRQERLLEEALASPGLDAGAAGKRDARLQSEPIGIPADELSGGTSDPATDRAALPPQQAAATDTGRQPR